MLDRQRRVRRRRLARAAHAADERPRESRAAGRIARRRAGRGGASRRCAPRSGCAALVADLLLLARADAAARPAATPLTSAEIAGRGRRRARRRQRRARARARRRSRPSSTAARDELHRLVINLLENAIRHTPRGRDDPRATPGSAMDAPSWSSRTTGPGIPRSCGRRCSSASSAAPATAGGSFGLGPGDRQARRGRCPRRDGGAGARPPGSPSGARRSSVRACPRCRQTSTTTGRTIGRRSSRS